MSNSGILYNLIRLLFLFLKRNIPIINRKYLNHLLNKGIIIPTNELDTFINASNAVHINIKSEKYYVGLVRIRDSFDEHGYIQIREDWPKYERFLKNNNILYDFYDIQNSTWQTDVKKYNIIIWATSCSPSLLYEARSKIYFLENYLKIKCYPSYKELWSYEDKIRASYLFKHFELPSIPTFISNSKNEAMEFVSKTEFPLIAKIASGSSSYGVLKLKGIKDALKYIESVFSEAGRKTYWQFLRQKDYVYFQKFIDDAAFDLRIIVIGEKLFGYYRYAKKNDFRASGAGIVEKKSLPEEAMRIAITAKEKFKTSALAVDMLYSIKEQKYFIIETSIFIGVDTPEQLVVEGVPGYYKYHNNTFSFEEGRYWIQELVLQDFFNNL